MSEIEEHKSHFLAYTRFLKHTRPIAYSSEMGEVARHHWPKVVYPLYGLSFGYIGLDIVNKIYEKREFGNRSMMVTGVDNFVWHGFASFLFPGLAINRGIHYTKQWSKGTRLPIKVKRFGPSLFGLALIPFIVHPIDDMTDWLMDNTFRKVIKEKEE